MTATLVSPTPKSVYEYDGRNLAPRRPLEEMRQNNPLTGDKNKLTEALISKYQDYKQRDYQAWHDVVDIGQMVANLRTGKMLLLRNVRDGRYMFVKRDGKFTDHKTVGGVFQFYSTKLTAEWLSSRPARDPVVWSDDDRVEEYTSAVKIVQDYFDKRFNTDIFETRQSLSAQDYGTWIARYRYDPEIKEIVCELLDFPACRWDIRFMAEESSYFIYESMCSTAKLEHILGADISSDDTFTDQYGLQKIREIVHSMGGNAEGEGKDRPWGTYDIVQNETIVTEMWLQPEEYCDIELTTAEPTISGVSLPQGKSLLEMFPDGMCAVGINNMNTIIGLYNESHKDHIVSGIFHAQSFTGLGKGVSDAVDVKKEMDDFHSQMLASLKAHGTPATFYNQDLITEQNARKIGRPKAIIPVDFALASEGITDINQAVQRLTPSNPAQGMFEYRVTLETYLQRAFQVTPGIGEGLPNVDNSTATGAQIYESNERMMLVPQHRNKANFLSRADKVIFNLFKKYVDKEEFFKTRALNNITKAKYMGKKNSYMSSIDYDKIDVEFEIVADSEIPKTRFTKEMSLTKLLNFTGGITGLIEASQIDPEMTSACADAFGVDLPIAKGETIAKVCRQRVDQAKQMLEAELQLQQMMTAWSGEAVDNANLPVAIVDQLMPPIIPAEPHSTQKVQWLSLLLDDDEMSYAAPEMRQIVAEMINRHVEAAAGQQAIVGYHASQANVMASMPELLGQAAMSQKNQQMQQEFEMQQVQMQQQQQLAEAGMQAEVQKSQAEAQEDSADAQMGRQLMLESAKMEMDEERASRDHQRNLEIEKTRQKARGAVAK